MVSAVEKINQAKVNRQFCYWTENRFQTQAQLLLAGKSIFKRQVMTGKGRLFYSGSWQPRKMVGQNLKNHFHQPVEGRKF